MKMVGTCFSDNGDMSRVRQLASNARGTFATLMRAPRPAAPRPAWPSPGRLALGATIAIAATAAAMLVLDARALGAVRLLPAWFIAAFEYITDFGLSGWFLWPTGLLLIAMAMVDRPALPRMTRGV